ncbi:hypothetical protein ACELLULO517_07125 [Acidisoma cellulosilytica]|uniref:Uncharacterized protein n=1 Tax=Acidisoma cellulosilyticum TaxID=2802395 RepID=A0A963YZN1_9PROT|nr:hypothetical protein [Acidisoma cellulosilyticum]MCB8880000.1 hypothetical protein [Acidisoma cellulosilyticum]
MTPDPMITARRPDGALAPLPRAKLSRFALTLLYLLRIYVLIAIPIVAYAFIQALHQAPH